MISRKINTTMKNKEDLKHLRAPELGEADWRTENEEEVRRHSLRDGRSVCGATYFTELKFL